MAEGKGHIEALIRRRILVLDGAWGTELQKKGMPPGVAPESWSLAHPDVLEDIHRRYVDAGADVIYTATFGANRAKLGSAGARDIYAMNRKLAGIAGRASGSRVLVAGDIGPTGQLIEPFGPLGFEETVGIFKEQVRGLLAGGVELFAVETMIDIQEARAALIAVKELTDAFTMVTMTFDEDARTLTGTDPVAALITLQSLGADAVGCNCSLGPAEMLPLMEMMKPYATVPLVAKPNAGLPELVRGKTVFRMSPGPFSSFAKGLAKAGAGLVGGCCGTTPDHIAKLKKALSGLRTSPPRRRSLSAVSSARGFVMFEKGRPVRIVGERINPTGKKNLQEELRRGSTALVRQMAREQEAAGADLLDVNVGAPGIDERNTMKKAVLDLAVATALPLVIDSPNADTIEAALRIYPGRALINSVSGEKKKTARLLSAAVRYGAMCIVLPLDDRSVPASARGRIRIIERICRNAQARGLAKDDLLVDGLVMTVSSDPSAPAETLAVIDWCDRVFGCGTIVGLSNVSFGMPERKWINAAFMAMACARGLTCAIASPGAEELMHLKAAGDLLAGRDAGAAAYITRFAAPAAPGGTAVPQRRVTADVALYDAVVDGAVEEIEPLIAAVLGMGRPAGDVVREIMAPAITKTGELYESKRYFLPQLIAAAEAMKKGMKYLEPHLRKERVQAGKKGRILMATVKGDIHDIGKNIVALMLENHGFDVVDLGKDVSAETIVARARKINPDVIGLSALMTTTMVYMKEVVDHARREGLACRFMVGGAVITDAFARSIGAHFARDGVEAVRVAERLIGLRRRRSL